MLLNYKHYYLYITTSKKFYIEYKKETDKFTTWRSLFLGWVFFLYSNWNKYFKESNYARQTKKCRLDKTR